MKKLLVLAIVSCLIVSTAGCGPSNGKLVNARPTSSAAKSRSESLPPSADDIASAVSSYSSNAESESSSSTIQANSISGSNAYDITISLQNDYSIPRGPLKNSASGSIAAKDSTSSVTDKNGLTLSYHLSCANDNSIISGSFTADNSGTVSASNFLNVAKKYLSYCASYPYTAANSDAASTWARTVLDKATKSGTSVAFGDCKFTIYRTDKSIWMEIEKFEK